MVMRKLSGGCHCGDVRFEVEIDFEQTDVVDCNCSICTKKGFLHAIVPPSRFRLLTSTDALSTYAFNTGVAKHTFCKRCGIHSFYTPRSHPDHIDVNVRCLDDIDVASLKIDRFDGQNWEDNVDTLRKEST
jgi:hypothetical protein